MYEHYGGDDDSQNPVYFFMASGWFQIHYTYETKINIVSILNKKKVLMHIKKLNTICRYRKNKFHIC